MTAVTHHVVKCSSVTLMVTDQRHAQTATPRVTIMKTKAHFREVKQICHTGTRHRAGSCGANWTHWPNIQRHQGVLWDSLPGCFTPSFTPPRGHVRLLGAQHSSCPWAHTAQDTQGLPSRSWYRPRAGVDDGHNVKYGWGHCYGEKWRGRVGVGWHSTNMTVWTRQGQLCILKSFL